MDPVTILSLITGAGSVGKLLFQSGESLYKFIERTLDVDQSIRALHRETAGLGQTLTAIRDALQHPAVKNHRTIIQDYALVWRTLDTSIRDCDDTAKTMKRKFQSGQSTRISFLSQARRQYRLSLNQDEIRDLRFQIHTHGSRLQLSLQMISVIASITAPDRVIESINPRLDHLIAMIQNQTLSQTEDNADPVGSQLSQQLNQELQSAAEVVVTSASSIIGDSRSTISGRSTSHGMTGSERGTPLDARQTNSIQGWIPPPGIIEEDVLSASSQSRPPSTIFSRPSESVFSSATGSDITVLGTSGSLQTVGKFELETIQRLLDRGKKAHESEKYDEAVPLFEQTITRIKKLPVRKQPLSKTTEAEILLAHSHLQMQLTQAGSDLGLSGTENEDASRTSSKTSAVLKSAEDLLSGVLKGSIADEDQRHVSSYALSVVYCYQKRYEEAYELCRKNVSQLRAHGVGARLQSTSKKSFLAAFLGLLRNICKLRGDEGEAAVYEDIRTEMGYGIGTATISLVSAKGPASYPLRICVKQMGPKPKIVHKSSKFTASSYYGHNFDQTKETFKCACSADTEFQIQIRYNETLLSYKTFGNGSFFVDTSHNGQQKTVTVGSAQVELTSYFVLN